MFDIAWSELMLIGAVALVAIPPKDLPKAMRTVGQTVGKIRRMAGEFQSQFNDAMRDAELHDLKKQVEDIGGSVSNATKTDFNPIEQIRTEFGSSTASTGLDDAALKEAEAKLAALPAPEPLPEVVIDPAPAAGEKPKRKRVAKSGPAAEPVVAVEAPPAAEKPVRKRKAKADESSSA